jgi:hypothetical protein
VSELYNIANDMHLRVPDMGRMMEKLNDAGGETYIHGHMALTLGLRLCGQGVSCSRGLECEVPHELLSEGLEAVLSCTAQAWCVRCQVAGSWAKLC